MTNNQIAKEIQSLVSRVIKIPEDKLEMNANLFTDLGVDSLLGVEIFAALDRKYGVDIPEEKIKNINTLRDIIFLVVELSK